MRSFFKRFSITGSHSNEKEKKEEAQKEEKVVRKYDAPVFRKEVEEKSMSLSADFDDDEYFFGACFRGEVASLKNYLSNQTNEDVKKSRIRSKDSFGRTALHFACDAGVFEIVKLLVTNGAYAYDVDSEGYTPVHRAARNGSVEIIEFLLNSQEKSDLERVLNLTTKETRRTPLHIATLECHHGVAKVLLKHGAKRNIQDIFGNAPKHYGLRYDGDDVRFGGDSEDKKFRNGLCC